MKLKIVVLSFLMVILSTAFSNAGSLDDSLNKAKSEGKIVMLELGSVGCVPCEQMKPVMAKLSDSYKGKMEVFFIDVRKDHDAARRFRVFAIPVQVFLDKDGKEFHRHTGFYPYEEITPVLKKAGI